MILYKYYPPERFDILRDRFVYFSHPNRFNDPFELEPHLESVNITPAKAEILAKSLQQSGLSFTKEEILANTETDAHRRKAIEELKQNLLILSLSEEPDNLLMWAHYAAAHTGFVVGFDTAIDSFVNRADGRSRHLSKVRYSTHRPSAESVFDVQEQEVRLTKSVEWMHEKEWRMFEAPFNADGDSVDPQNSSCWPFRFLPDVVVRVVLGARVSKATEEKIRGIVHTPEYGHVKLIRSVIDERQFRLNPQED